MGKLDVVVALGVRLGVRDFTHLVAVCRELKTFQFTGTALEAVFQEKTAQAKEWLRQDEEGFWVLA